MTALAGSSPKAPAWIHTVHRLVLHGHQDPDEAEELARLWESHLLEYQTDHFIGRLKRALNVVGSAIAHVVWRLRFGPSTPVGAGVLFAGVGFATATFALSESLGFFTSYIGPAALGLVLFGWSVARHLGRVPLINAIVVAAFAIPSLVGAAIYYWNEQALASDFLVVAAAFSGIVSMLSLVWHSANKAARPGWGRLYAWSLIGAVVLLALANAHGALVYTSPELVRASLVAFCVESALAFWLVRNWQCLYESNNTKALVG